MSQASDCCGPCPTSTVVEIPGTEGDPGQSGSDGADGISAFTLLTSDLTLPVGPGPVSMQVAENAWAVIGQTIFASDGTDWGTFTVTGLTGSTVIDADWDDAPNDSAGGSVIGTGGQVTPSGQTGALSAALPTAITDNTTGTASNSLDDGTGQFTHSIYFRAAAITGNVLVYTYTPSYRFKIVRISASVVDAITTGGSAATLTTAIAGTPTTGGIVIMSGTYALGAEQASSAAITALNVGTSAEAVTVTASAVTPFVEGGFMLHMQIQNMDSADTAASLADHINDLITALT